MHKLTLFALTFALAAAPACAIEGTPGPGDDAEDPGGPGGSGDDGTQEPDPPDPDPADDPEPEPQPEHCLVAGSYELGPAQEPIAGAAEHEPGKYVVFLPYALNDDANPDVLFVELWDGYGVFASGFRTGTFPITGVETDLLECGACVGIAADYNRDTGPAKVYAASDGSMTIEEINGTRVRGSLNDVTLREVTFGEETGQQNVPGGCTTSIQGFSFDAPIQFL